MPATASTQFSIDPVPAFRDNYLWLLSHAGRAAIVDPGDAAPVFAALAARGLTLEAILVTHHHADHTGGVADLARATGASIFAPAGEKITTGGAPARPLREGDAIEVLGQRLRVIDVPGHTAGHIAYHAPALQALFCGDTLFAGGCGRLFEGTPAQMLASLRKLAALPEETRVYCAHEYTLSNLRFALAVEPDNLRLQQRMDSCSQMRARQVPTVPSTVAEERETNPFLRVTEAHVRQAAEKRAPGAAASDESVFATLRAWKNVFS
jgi:hydroxyacylglutathione hydrolase